ncbi:YheC/YheD family protein [Paenibacillus filicis]|uniref:YheC/YheD family protein n=1 Tax=Paenibacillus gyeongsangnamensis TaxID=3388067 RepID=A0ABT4Q9U8_9BACL|nr:YheC/YheD family protein [Paenibacillus filicis]MCZ8513657.1 YheC/YheD family protein [Paenibacillus filicis]
MKKAIVRRRFVVSKWKKTKALLDSRAIALHIPETQTMTRAHLNEMLKKYGMVYVKPSTGTYGIGVMRIERETGSGSTRYRFQAGTRIRSFTDYDAMYDAIKGLTGGRLYLAQKGIQLLKHQGRRFDLRVMVQLSPQGRWETTGLIGRLAAANKVVTNIHNGGTLYPVETLLSSHLSGEETGRLLQKLRRLGTSVARQLYRKYPGLKEIGLDVALDEQLHPWVLEVNTCPDPWIFRKLKDKRIFSRIYRYCKAYGRL